MPRALLRFVAHTQFRYGVRSIACLIDAISVQSLKGTILDGGNLGLPLSNTSDLLESTLRFHLSDERKAVGIVQRWREFANQDCAVRISNPELSSVHFDPMTGKPISYG
jgi:hypothetical protein